MTFTWVLMKWAMTMWWGDAAAPGDLGGAILDPILDHFVEDEGGDLSTDGMEGGLADPDAVQAGVISQEQADIIFGEVERLPEEEELSSKYFMVLLRSSRKASDSMR